LLGLVVLESVEEEGGSLLNHVGSHEDVDDLRVCEKMRVVSWTQKVETK